ncbi:fimbrial protein [Enterobacter sichuanensis]|uniref:fimbrial protein n=1 Tax=Enterobacter sichuanensis TaxID=2071710 RepID=UPI002DBBC9B9|nr:fimbrial protein [Enterobacter sichuanensis]MEB5959744.1 fimbrial protein [Enterobacter sichuanensis]
MNQLTSTRYAAVYIALFVLSGTFSARAVDTTLQISGNVTASTCEIEAGSVDQHVKIGTFSGKDFPAVGSTSSFKAMNINLKNCYEKLSSVLVKFSGVADADNPTLLAVTDTGAGGTLATGIGVELLDNGGKNIPFNSDTPLTFELEEGNNTLSFLLRYKSTRYPVTAGDASAVMYFNLTYQ